MKRLIRRTFLSSALFLSVGVASGCSDPEGEQNNTPIECVAGQVGCACTSASTCGDGAVCEEGMCVGVAVSGLTISSELARSCEVLLLESGSEILGATYADGVQGAWRKRAPNVALALSQTSDATLPAGTASLQISGDPSGLSIQEVSCFDAQGVRIDGVTASFE